MFMKKILLFSLTFFFLVQLSAQICFGPITNYTFTGNSNLSNIQICSGDFNKDGFADIASITNDNGSNIKVYLSAGVSGVLTSPVTYTAIASNQIMSIDINKDGFLDILTRGKLLFGDGTGSFTDSGLPGSPVTPFTCNDFNNDGFLDIAGKDGSGNVHSYMGNSAGAFTSYTVSASLDNFDGIVSSDFNNDGFIDVAYSSPGNIYVALGTGTGSFGATITHNFGISEAGNSGSALATSDFNHDGKADIVETDGYNNLFVILLGTGTGNFTQTGYNTGNSILPGGIFCTDYNGDGYTDVALLDTYTGNHVSISLGKPNGVFSAGIQLAMPTWAASVYGGDINGDGKIDLLTSSLQTSSNTGTISIFLNTLPYLQVNATSTICAGNSDTLTASGATSYVWSSNAGSATTSSVVVIPSATTTYSITGNTGSCSNTKTLTVNVSMLNISGTTSICSGSSTTLTANGSTSYTWMPGSITTSSMVVTPTITTTYTVTSVAGSCNFIKTVTVIVSNTPTLTATANTATVCAGTAITLTGSGAAGYTWTPGSITTATASVTPFTSTTYTLTGKNGACSAVTKTVTVTALNPLSVNSTSICAGSTTTLTASGSTTYTWNTGATVPHLIITPTVTTTYTVTGIDTISGCSLNKITTVTVNPSPTISTPGNYYQTVCVGASVSAITFSVTPSGSSINWTNNNTAIGLAASNSGNINGFSAAATNQQEVGIITVNVTTSDGCQTSTATQLVYTITVNPKPIIFTNSFTLCSSGVTTATLTSSGAQTYTWSTAETGSVITPSPTSTTVYTVTGTNASSCVSTTTASVVVTSSLSASVITATASPVCIGSTANLVASGANTYTWSTGVIGNTLQVSPVTTTNYTLLGTDANNCVSSYIAGVTVNSLPTVTTTNGTICAGQSYIITASGANTYTWSTTETTVSITTSPTVTTNYTVTGTDINGCVNSNTSTVTVNAIPIITVSSTDVSCFGLSNGSATVSISGNPPYTYSWSPSGGNNSTANNLAIGNYTLAVTDINNCNSSATVSINQPSLLSISASQTAKDCGNSNGSATSATNGGTTPYSYVWNTAPSQTGSIATNLSAGIYTCTVQDANGCSNFISVVISDSCDMVWPGDANNDLITDNNDILAIGVGNNISGTTRNNATINWTAQPSTNWINTLANGANYKHIDCDGNGTINLSDTVAVIQNFNLTHPAGRLTNPNQTYTSGAPLIIVPQQNNILSGNSGTFDIMLGNSVKLANNAYGIAFTMQYNNTYIDGTSININGNGSWMGIINNNIMALSLRNISQSEIEFAVTKTDHNNVTGQGKIGEITFKTLPNTANNSTASFIISNATLVSYDQTNIPIDLSAATATVNIVTIAGINQFTIKTNFNIYPNPNNGTFTIETNNSVKQILQIFDVNGRLVLNQTIIGKTIIDADNLINGVYNINISSNEGVINRRLIITR